MTLAQKDKEDNTWWAQNEASEKVKVVIHDLHACHRFKLQRGMFVMLSWSEGVASWFLKSGQSLASPEGSWGGTGVQRQLCRCRPGLY